jgi:hypothetical protein
MTAQRAVTIAIIIVFHTLFIHPAFGKEPLRAGLSWED